MSEFTLRSTTPDGETIYGAPHELHNEVLITFPVGYWEPVDPPQTIYAVVNISDSNVNTSPPPRRRRVVRRCPDCGEYGQIAGHMTCPTPQNHE